MGLTHPSDLDAWHAWQARGQSLPRRVKGLLKARRAARPAGVLTVGGPRPDLLVALDALKATTSLAQLAPLRHLDLARVAVLSPHPVEDQLPPHAWQVTPGPLDDLLADLRATHPVVLSTGHYLPLGAAAREVVAEPHRFVTVQHGLLTPAAPPLAPGTTLLAWSERDGDFWRSGRADIEITTVGSELLWRAGSRDVPPLDSTVPVYLGQLHGAELPRAAMAAAAHDFCLARGAAYRPHPSETDRRSVATHARWESAGITIDRSGVPLRDLRRPVVSVYSTGVLEAAARGLPAWVDFPEPPDWLVEFWDRYGMARWGGEPTPAPQQPPIDPSLRVADVLRGMMGS